MKRLFRLLSVVLAVLLFLAACELDVPDQDPVIHGAVDKEIARGTAFVPLEGITAEDDEDGDLTEDIVYSGDVNPNVAGTYEANYTVTDSAGNTTTVTITITVVDVDTEAPLISGAGDIDLIVGDEDFDPMAGVVASDTVDGDVTTDLELTGEFDVWTPGEYVLTYTVEDTAGNPAQRDRTVSVTTGTFAFADDDLISNGDFDSMDDWVVGEAQAEQEDGILTVTVDGDSTLSQAGLAGGVINPDIADFGLLKLVFVARAEGAEELMVTLDGASSADEEITLTSEYAEYVKYFRIDQVLDDATLTFNLRGEGTLDFDAVELIVAQSADTEAPILDVPDTDVVVPVNDTDALHQLVLKNVTAMDDVDGNVTSLITLDLDGIDIDQVGTVDVPITVTDDAGNETRVLRTVHLRLPFDTDVITDPAFDDELDEDQWGLSGGSEDVTLYNEDGTMVVDIINPGGWDSATSPYLRNVTTDDLQAGNTYMFKFDVKADVTRQMRMRAGLELYSDPWIEDFNDGAVKNLQYRITDEWTTIYYVFDIDSETSSEGSNLIKFEIKVGTITWGSEEKNNKVYLDNAQFYLLSDVDHEPVISDVSGVPYSFVVGDEMPDFTNYILVEDLEDGTIDVTPEMIDSSAVDMDTAGTYDVTFTVQDSGSNEVTHTITITVLSEQDTTPPVLTRSDELQPTTFDQFEETDIDFTEYFTAVDDIDGNIEITDDMIDLGGFSLDTAGTYTVTWTVSDSSQNETVETLQFVVNDKEGPAINGLKDVTMNLGETFDPLEGITGNDNVDGEIELTMDDVAGTDAFLDADNVAVEIGEFVVTYSLTDEAGNTTEQEINVTVLDLEFDETKETDLLAMQIPVQNDGGSVESEGTYNPDGSLTLTYNGVKGWYGSYSKITYSDVTLLEDRMYKLVIEAEAETARDILVRFVGEDGTALEAFADRLVVPLSDEMEVFELIFTLDKSGPYNVQLQFGWESTLNNVSDPNVLHFEQFKLIPEKVLEFDMDQAVDLLALENSIGNDGGDIESEGTYNQDGSLTVTYNGVKGWYASYSKITYYQSLTENNTYKLMFEAQAETPRDILLRFVDSSNTAVEGFEDRMVIPLETEPMLYELVFTAPASDTYNLQIHFGWEDYLTNASNANTIDITTFKLVPEASDVVVEESIFLLDDFESYAEQADLDEVYTHRVPNAGENHNDEHILLGDFGQEESQGVRFMIGEHDVTGWDLFRTKSDIDKTGLTDDYDYFGFWFQSDDISTIYVWLYWSGSQNSVSVDVSAIAADGGYVVVPLSSWGKTATQINAFAIGYDLVDPPIQGTVYLDDIMFLTSPEALEE